MSSSIKSSVSESQLQSNVLRMLKKDYPAAWVWKISDRWVSGLPDLFIISGGRHVFIELKRPGCKLEKIQSFVNKKIVQAGGEGFVCQSVDEVKNIMKGGRQKCQRKS